MLKISSIIIAKDEEKNIRRCIESQLGCIDEIILVIDSRTTDSTALIASNYPSVKVEIRDWEGYAQTKKFAVDSASYNWIFWIDADEEITPALADEMKEFKLSEPVYEVYDVARRAYFLGKWIKHSGWYPGRICRLFNRKNAGFSDKEVHENLVFSGERGHLHNDLNHYTDPDISHYFEKFNNYTSLAASELLRNNKKASFADIFLRPVFLFVKMYVIKKGFLDGFHGFVLAMFSAFYVFVKYTKLWEAERKQ